MIFPTNAVARIEELSDVSIRYGFELITVDVIEAPPLRGVELPSSRYKTIPWY